MVRSGASRAWNWPRNRSFIEATGTEPQTLDPHRAEGVPSSNILRDLFEGLVAEAPDGQLIPGAAESWEISEDGLTYTFTMRPDGRWSNGDLVTARDFEYGLRRSVDPETLSRYSSVLAPIKNARAVIAGDLPPEALGVEAIDDRTFVIRLETPTPYLLGLLTHSTCYAVHRGAVEEHGALWPRVETHGRQRRIQPQGMGGAIPHSTSSAIRTTGRRQ